MKKIYIAKFTETEPDFSAVAPLEVGEYVWGGDYRPHTEAKLAVTADALWLQMTCAEKDPLAVYKNHNDPVCRDSCMEFFFSETDGGKYMNFEMNSIGTSLCEYGAGRGQRIYVSTIAQPPVPKVERTPNSWSVTVRFGREFLDTVFGEPFSLERGAQFYANFYKCGDDTEHEHYGMWNPVASATPDYHRPESFGIIKID